MRNGEGRGPGKKGELGDDSAESWSEPECWEASEEVRERFDEEKLDCVGKTCWKLKWRIGAIARDR